MTIDSPEALDALPVGAIISDHGRLAAKSSVGAWIYGDGEAWQPRLPVTLLGVDVL
ncbi:hypothetical protein [Nocardia australiensis]|uniref:hypothetical protein n=1 Tax=Nocardia australiensis TaxID=2887191 RepID=UPI001D1485DF|nr:hypothetical protein [Nocardia australiensis]